ncbi:hypothetical protein ACR3I8_18220, partial [Priestia flexa]
ACPADGKGNLAEREAASDADDYAHLQPKSQAAPRPRDREICGESERGACGETRWSGEEG